MSKYVTVPVSNLLNSVSLRKKKGGGLGRTGALGLTSRYFSIINKWNSKIQPLTPGQWTASRSPPVHTERHRSRWMSAWWEWALPLDSTGTGMEHKVVGRKRQNKMTKNIRVSHVKHSRCHSKAKYQKMLKCFNSFTTYEHMLQNYKHNVSDLGTLWLTPCG